MLSRNIHSACLLALVTIAGAGCSDSAPPTSPKPTPAVAAFTAAGKPRPARLPYISDVQINAPYVSISGVTPITVKVTNPSPKDVQGIFLKGEIDSFNNMPPVVTNFIAFCPAPTGVVPKGDCTMNEGINGGSGLAPGPGTFILRLLQQQSDGTMTVLDTKVIDVELRQY